MGKLYRSIFSLRFQLVSLQLAVVFSLVLVAAVVASGIAAAGKRTAEEGRIAGIARAVAGMPMVVSVLRQGADSGQVVAMTRLVEEASRLDFVVLVNLAGIRVSHPEDSKLGLPASSDHSEVQQGREFIGVEQGSRGSTFRVKVPVYDGAEILGSVSVGISESELRAQLQPGLPVVLIWLAFAAGFGTLAAVVVTRLVWRRIYGQEPAEILRLLRSHDAMMTHVHEGVIAVDDELRIVLVNDEAGRLLGVDGPQHWEGQVATKLLPAAVNDFIAESVGERKQSLLRVGERTLLAGTDGTVLQGRQAGRLLTLQDRTELRDALGELAEQRSLSQALRTRTHEFANRLHVIAGLLEMGQTQPAVDYLDGLIAPRGVEAEIPEGVGDPTVTALLRVKSAIADRMGVLVVLDQNSRIAQPGVIDDEATTVLANLITNAVEAAGRGGTVEVLLSDAGAGLFCRVSDDGPGIPQQARQEIFEYGVSSKVADLPEEHRGVGLASVQQIVLRRKGTMEIADGPMGGAMITVNLPVSGTE